MALGWLVNSPGLGAAMGIHVTLGSFGPIRTPHISSPIEFFQYQGHGAVVGVMGEVDAASELGGSAPALKTRQLPDHGRVRTTLGSGDSASTIRVETADAESS